jgi:hypothetical protein
MAETKKAEKKPSKKAASKKPTAKDLPPIGSSERKSLILQGIIKE